ncbi:hypothetical protein BaRGS_00032700 [Batillaria attramentaria]|uniref:Ig-like domain-containing protein n=1 Tax=Batillaria attramentaria TaxID=370345 RepID=A0ABD0JMS6_9CAEN
MNRKSLLVFVLLYFVTANSVEGKDEETPLENSSVSHIQEQVALSESEDNFNSSLWTADKQNGGNSDGRLNRDTRRRRGMMSKLKKMWKKKMGKKSGEWVLSTEEAGEHFQSYYECLGKRVEAATSVHHGVDTPVHAVMVLEGETVTLGCLVCTRPDQDKLSQQAIWQHLRRSDSSLGNVHYDDRIQMTPQSGLVIKGADVADAGQYSCLHLGDYVAIYQVDVLPKERRKRVRLGESLLQEVYLPSHNLRVLTVWSSWGSCDACDVIGHRQRTGTCTVLKIDPDDRVKPRDFPMIDLYPDGVPCRSTALPGHLRRLKVVRHRYEETLVAECNVSCPTEAPPVAVTDSDGKVLELVEPVKLYSLGEMPPLPKMVKRRVLYEPEGKHLVLTCGSETQRGTGLRWMRGKRRVDPMSIKRQTLGRVWIDSANRLHLKDLMLSDTAVYNCWERELHVAAIKVLVISAMNEKLKDYITITGFVVTCIGSLVACCCLMRRGQTAR